MGYESEGGLKIYLREISQTSLLTFEEENILAEKIQHGTPEEQEKARDHMIRANLRLVVKLAQEYANNGLPLLDLISEGNIGLMKAVERFDPEKGNKISTYAVWWIKQSIKLALTNQSKTIRLPVHTVDKITRIRRIANILTAALGREPTHKELADEVGVSIKKIRDLLTSSQVPVSLNIPVNEGEVTELSEIIADVGAGDPGDMLADSDMIEHLNESFGCLEEREKIIIEHRFGINGRDTRTLDEVGELFGVTRERIRQIQNSALLKMRKAIGKKERQPIIAHSVHLKPTQKNPLVGKKVKQTKHKKRYLSELIHTQSLLISDDDKYNRYLDLLINNEAIQKLEEERGSVYFAAQTFLQKMDAIRIPGEEFSAAEILKSVILYSFASGQGQMPKKIRAQHIVNFLRNHRVA